MYNRYVPKSDGSFQRKTFPDPPSPPQKPPQETGTSQPECDHPPAVPCPVPPAPRSQDLGAGDFLRRLLPKNLDTGDLMVLLLLLLMAGDCQEDKNTALLTLALYLFM